MPVGGGGLVPNLLADNVDAAVVYSPLSFQISKSGEARTILDYSKEVPPNLTAGWIVLDKFAEAKARRRAEGAQCALWRHRCSCATIATRPSS